MGIALTSTRGMVDAMDRMPFTLPRGKLARIACLLVLTTLSPSTRSQELVLQARAATAANAAASPTGVAALLAEARILLQFDLHLAAQRADEAHRVASLLRDDTSRALALSIKARAAAQGIGRDVARAAMTAANAILPSDAPTAAVAEVTYAAALLHWTHDEPAECIGALRKAFDLADQAKAQSILIKANILAIGVIGWPDQPVEEMTRLLGIAEAAGSIDLAFECRVLISTAKLTVGATQGLAEQNAKLLEEAKRLGDRALQSYLEQQRARQFVPDDLPSAQQQIQVAIKTSELHGNREQLALAHDYAARLHLHSSQLDEAMAESEAAIAALAGMGMTDREITIYGTASHIALSNGQNDQARIYSERVTTLQRATDQRASSNQRTRLWRDANVLSRNLREANEQHKITIRSMAERQHRSLWAAAIALLVVLAIASTLLLRDRRRLSNANDKLASALNASSALQEERTALEQHLQRIERLDSIGLLAGGFAHDFNNILVSVSGNTQLTLADPATTPSQRELLEQVLLASNRAADLCKDILSYANAEPSPRSLIDVRETIHTMVPLARAGFGASIDVTMALGDQPSLVQVDRTQIEQVLLNILVNAGDAIKTNGSIHISVDTQRLDGNLPTGYWFGEFDGQERDYIAVSVLDNGQGMKGETIRRIFDPFFSTRFAGRGLGLAGAFGILRRHQGLVEVQSTVGLGTQFTIYLPQHDAEAAATEEPTVVLPCPPRRMNPPTAPASTATVLVVDDEPTICEVVRGVLEADGHKVITAHHGIDALAIAEDSDNQIDLAIIDVTMPGMDGPTLAHNLRNKIPGLRIVMMTGHAESAMHANGNESPLILKPFDLQGLRNTINATLTAEV